MNSVTFPNLGLTFHVKQWAFSLFGIQIAWYGIIIALGFALASAYLFANLKRFGLDSDRVIDVLLASMIGGIIGARAYYVAFSWDQFQGRFWDILNPRLGGLAFYGALIGGCLVGLLVCKLRHVKMRPMLDVAAMGFLIGQGIGRWGNFVNIEAYGAETSSSYLFGMGSNTFAPEVGLVHPCFLYESLWCILGFIVLHLYRNHRKFDGEIALLYLAWNGAGRAVIEGLRTDSLYLAGLRVSQILAILMCLTSITLIAWIRVKIKRNQIILPLYVDTEQSKQLVTLASLRKERKQVQSERKDDLTVKQADDSRPIDPTENDQKNREDSNYL